MKNSGNNGTNKSSKLKGKKVVFILIVENATGKSVGMGFGGKLFAGTRGFDPITIIMQIIAMQFVYYLTLSLSMLIVTIFFYPGLRPHLG